MRPYVSLRVFNCAYASLWVLIDPYASLWILKGIYGFLKVRMRFFFVVFGPYKS